MSSIKRKGLTPNLRFPEFLSEPEWDLPELEEISDRIQEKAGDSELETISISAGIGFVSQKEKFSRDISGQQYKNYIKLKKGEFAYNKGNSKKFPQGCIYKLKEYNEGAAPNSFICFRFKPSVVPDFYQGYFESNFHGKQLTKYITSGARMDGLLNISPANFFKIILPTPSKKEEQQKIADCLSSLDELIQAETERLEGLQAHKKGLMQQLFPADGETVPKLRFPEFKDSGEWVIKSVKDNIDLITGIPIKSEDITDDTSGVSILRGINITEGQIRHSIEIDKYYKGDNIGLDKYFLAENDIVIGMDGSKVGKNVAQITRNDQGSILIQRVARIRAKNSDLDYMYQNFLSQRFRDYVDKVNTSSGIPHISSKQIDDFEIGFPPKIQEQEKISSFLKLIDSSINSQSEKIESLKSHKKGLLQQLFPQLES
ncbi:restriction endonuclease subunit S [Mongoliitalea daihaiensis]|uniref:restriction endonuclease subunit S n=1 Tax=Mongoliitalea daihaiensis TaxID=2782006 RepID=UPI001F1B50D2|nr:restriction endonuclease subunit S [Mongoliitalea daihaiensis]UJP63821.1 restriction endonuclease subunit S [Mongoliitalea daihaiensis]